MDLEYFLRPSRWVFYAHSAFWMAFLVARMRVLAEARAGEAADGVRHDDAPVQARFAGALVRLHVVALVGLYPALWIATTTNPLAPPPVPGGAGVALLLAGGAVASWAISVFRSYKLRATLEAGHELCTDGPFRYVRHPLYLAFGLLGLRGGAVGHRRPARPHRGAPARRHVRADLPGVPGQHEAVAAVGVLTR
jgi:protein-S-isoprenylcysteine O-methyltransferase Ste14